MRTRADKQALEPEEIAFLEVCYNAIIARRKLTPDTANAEDIARALIIAYQRGVRDQAELIRLADIVPL
jgi:hypothetical protein